MKLKNILLMGLSLVLVAVLAIGGTVAYLTDTDSDVNVMTTGNVKIEQIEQERAANGTLVDFTQGKPALPAVGSPAWDDTKLEVNGGKFNMFDNDKFKNTVDKIVSVKNTGKSDAYFRTIIAIEDPFSVNLVGINVGDDAYIGSPWYSVVINGVTYSVKAYTYKEILEPGEASLPSLLQAYIASAATNEDCAMLGDTWDILALSQAVQAAGFDDAETALNEGFGEVNAENIAKWFEGITIPEVVQGDVVGSSTDYGYHVADGESVVFDDINVTSGGGISVWGTAEFNSGSIVTNSSSTSGRHVFYVAAGNDGEGLLTINDGEFTFSPNNLQRKGYYICAHGEGAVVIVNGGTFNKPSQRNDGMIDSDPYKGGICEYEGGQVIIRGGSFAFDPTEWVDEGYEAVKDDTTGYWTVSTKN